MLELTRQQANAASTEVLMELIEYAKKQLQSGSHDQRRLESWCRAVADLATMRDDLWTDGTADDLSESA